MPRQTMSWEQIDRVIHRIRSLVPIKSRIIEFGISPLTPKLTEIFNLQIIERGKVARRRDVDPNFIQSTPIKETKSGNWFWFPDKTRIPRRSEMLILHDVEGEICPKPFIQHKFLHNIAEDILLISNRNEFSFSLANEIAECIDFDVEKILDEPDLIIWHLSNNIEQSKEYEYNKIDLISRLCYAVGWKKTTEKRVKRILTNNPDDIRYMEINARLKATPGSWEIASHDYERIFEIKPTYRDVAWQTVRSSIYSSRWTIVGRVLSKIEHLSDDTRIRKMIEKKFDLIGEDAAIKAIEKIVSNRFRPNWIIEKWVSSQNNLHRDMCSTVSIIALNSFSGTHIGYEVRRRIEMGEIENANKIIERCTEEYGIIPTLESICIDEILPPFLNNIIKEILAKCDSDTIHLAIQAIGRRGDPSQFLGRSSILEMIENGTHIQTWMIEFALRSNDKTLLNSLFERNLPGVTSALIDTLENLISTRRDARTTDLLESVSGHTWLYENREIRRKVCKALLVTGDSLLSHTFAMEAIRYDPQDAVCGSMALESSIGTGNSKLILDTADVTLSMRNRSSHIDYASIAIAAIRENQINYARDLLKRNRLRMNLQAQRIRVGIPFNIFNDWEQTLVEINLTPAKFRKDSTILIYEAKALAALMRHEAAEQVALELNDSSEKAILMYSLRHSWNDFEGALDIWNSQLVENDMMIMPQDWGDSGFDFMSLKLNEKSNLDRNGPLVSIIMTVHKWNDAFPLAVLSILNQTHSNIEFIIVDDCSPEEDVLLYDDLLTDDRIIRIRMDENVGTYACRNQGLQVAFGEFVTFADSDDWNHPERIERSLRMMNEMRLDLVVGRYARISLDGKIHFNGGRLSRFALMGMMIRRSVLVENGWEFDGNARTSADSELFERMRILLGPERILRHNELQILALHHFDSLTGGGEMNIDWTGPGEHRLRYVAGYTRFHDRLRHSSKNSSTIDFTAPSDSLLNLSLTSKEKRLRNSFGMNQITPKEFKFSLKDDAVTVFISTYPGGFEHVGDSIRSLLNQSKMPEKIILHVNSEKRPPRLPKDSRVKVILSSKNLADNGKFAHMHKYKGYFITADDDINYPFDYIETMINEVARFSNNAIVGIHGACLPYGPPLTRWIQYKSLRRSHIFTQEHASRIRVDILGTGTVAFHSSIGHPAVTEMDTLRMVDIHFSIWASSNQIPMHLVPRHRDWLTEFEDISEDRIWTQTQEDKELQIQMISILQRNTFWNRSSTSQGELLRGPLSLAKSWKHRELPTGIEISTPKKWEQLPKKPFVTIYIPAFNVENYILESINSALAQTYPRIEICVHDDGSTDDTLSIIRQNFGSNNKVKITTSENQGIGGASNNAISNGTGSLILQLDGDDTIEPDAIEKLLPLIHEGHVCVYGNFRRIDSRGTLIDQGWEEAVYSRERLLRSMIIHHPRLFRRDAWEQVGRHDEKLTNAVDYDLFLRLSEIGTMQHLREILYSYRILDTSTSRSKRNIQTENTYIVVQRSLERDGFSDFEVHVPNPEKPRQFIIRNKRFS